MALKSIAKVPNQKVTRRPKCFSFFFFFFFSFFFFFFRRASSNLRDSFTMVFAQNSSIFHRAVHQPIALKSHQEIRTAPQHEELWLPCRRHFSSRVRMRTNHLATKFFLFQHQQNNLMFTSCMVHKGRRKRIKTKKDGKKREHVKFVNLFTSIVPAAEDWLQQLPDPLVSVSLGGPSRNVVHIHTGWLIRAD